VRILGDTVSDQHARALTNARRSHQRPVRDGYRDLVHRGCYPGPGAGVGHSEVLYYAAMLMLPSKRDGGPRILEGRGNGKMERFASEGRSD
jgi:hypothetical protein